MKRFLTSITGLAAVAILGAGFSSSTSAATAQAPRHIKVVIQHQMRGCHAWSVNGGALGSHVDAINVGAAGRPELGGVTDRAKPTANNR